MSEYKALAGRIEAMARSYEDRSRLARTTQEDGTSERHSECAADLRTVVSLLEGMAEEKPAAWMALAYGLPSQATTDEPTAIRWRKAGGDVVPLYTHPAPAAPQADPKREPLSDERIAEIQRAAYERAAQECESRATAPQGEDYLACYYACADAIRALGRQHD